MTCAGTRRLIHYDQPVVAWIHAPARGATLTSNAVTHRKNVSIHAPARGATTHRLTYDPASALLRNSRLRHDSPYPLRYYATRMISAVPRTEKRFISATRIWISAVWRSESLAAMRSPKALRHRIFASIRLRAWYPLTQSMFRAGTRNWRFTFAARSAQLRPLARPQTTLGRKMLVQRARLGEHGVRR